MKTILSDSDWAQLQEIFSVAAELESAERDSYLDDVGRSSPELRERAVALLATLDSETGMGRIVGAAALQAVESKLPSIGGMLGPYRLTGIVGRGGMGVVYRAVRADDAYRKDVAVKVASFGMDTADLRRRFVRERQILANLEHPNIARIIDGGTTAEGTPYVVMEFVSGKPIHTWCVESKPDRRARIKLIIEVCRAVEYAHRHMVVHRDLKPDNILVTAEGIPKLLDFGIAKALNPDATEINSGVTLDAARLMTPDYASPEQVRGGQITTATDVYQLGILLYQLLTGRRPFEISTARIGELEKLICEKAPPRPRLDEDLDRIILHALEKEPERRYAMAGDLADDLDRYLRGFPVMARGASWSYQLGKFCQRYKLAVGAAITVFVILASFSVAMVIQARRLEQERNSAERVSQFLGAIFSLGNPGNTRGKQMSARDLLDMGAEEVEHATDLDPKFKDQLLNTLAAAYRTQSIFDRAYSLYSESLQIRKQLYGERSPQVAETLGILTDVDIYSEDYYRALADSERWFAIIKPIDDRYDAEALAALRQRAILQMYHNHLPDAEASTRRALDVARRVDGPDSFPYFDLYIPLGNLLYYEGKWDESEAVYRTALNHFRLGAWRDSPQVLAEMETATRLGFLLAREGRYAEAAPLLRETMDLRLKILGFAHDSTGASEAAAGFVLGKMGDVTEAEKFGRDGLHSREEANGAGSRNYGVDEGLLALTYLDEGKPDLAEPLMEQDVTLCRMHLGSESFLLARAMADLGRVQFARKKLDAAANNLQAALAMEIKLNGDNSPFAAADHEALGRLYAAQDRLPEAEASLRRAVAIYRTTAKEDRPDTANALLALARILKREGHGVEARTLLAEAAAMRTSFSRHASDSSQTR